jgi:flagellar biosynthesis protein FliP
MCGKIQIFWNDRKRSKLRAPNNYEKILSSDNRLSFSLLFTILSLVPSLFLILSSFYLLIVGVVGYCCAGSLSDTQHSVRLLGTSDHPDEENST